MLENIRESSQGLTAKIILGFIILTFAVAGIGSYSNSVDSSVADVNGEKITQDEFNKAYQEQRNRMAQQFGEMFETLSSDPGYMSNFRKGVVDNLINQKLIDQNSEMLAIRVADQRIKSTIRNMPEFQVDGVFDNNRYLAMINQAGFYQSSDFRDYLRTEMTRRQLTQALVASEFSLPYQESMFSALQNQERDIRFATINAEQFKATIELSDEEVNDYYLENQSRFENQEQVKVNYITLDVNTIASKVVLTDADVKAYYQSNISQYRDEEKRRVAHILIEFGDDEAKAKADTEALLAKINAGEDFATLAKENSADTFSGENGGDLDWIDAGVMDAAFDEAAFALTGVGSVSEVVKTDFGFHIIKLTDYKAENVQTLSEVREDIVKKAKSEKAQDKFFELQQEVARLSFEFPDSLDDAAGAINATVKTSGWLTRGANVAPFNESAAVDAAFSDIVVNEQLNSDVIEVSDTLAIVMRLNEYQDASIKPLADVSAQIKSILVAKKASEKAQTVADELLAAFKSGTDITEQLSAIGATMETKTAVTRVGSGLDASLAREAFKLPKPNDGAVSATTVNLSNGNLALLEVQSVKVGEAKDSPNLSQQLTQQLAQASYLSYVESLKVGAEIVRKEVQAPTTQY
ncbi:MULTISPECIES: SurA N-terminal domain-containing protein [unclassified Colwellia]|jgi:peptidyl-prolyl cis-trans isomerase D|uniref:SurA N-terminal domain-containing protein n=1 Tax=unclassified Colwellia TaxID=196834 RepID=UPI000D362DBC|nr:MULTISPECIES: SurA N-terminal domain-containing protein [unclassified Colwellia]AWB56919.1 peptidylprolyl isomerase [Colwellia sp. Arc7-D]MBA6415982.1 SurA N-terminal domain-containing protein [Colwellia sp. 6M3]